MWEGTLAAPQPCSLPAQWPAEARGPPTHSMAHARMAHKGLSPATTARLVSTCLTYMQHRQETCNQTLHEMATVAHLPIHLPHTGQAVVQKVAALRTNVNVVCIKCCPDKSTSVLVHADGGGPVPLSVRAYHYSATERLEDQGMSALTSRRIGAARTSDGGEDRIWRAHKSLPHPANLPRGPDMKWHRPRQHGMEGSLRSTAKHVEPSQDIAILTIAASNNCALA